ncbi:succinate dehydrogenase subunit 7A, mitochondrial-like [Chenopodium quinoa]|uniref:succinate dehydrogenase subunit 7A, mitochondrial-like n=1 Tax=Chenopodium quinoa TaxID=63459 RepID=UPI000B791B6A|nr:succinate dehydrogenase subunit 7A, mitochondrial-like [Chenopodium quinoa]
MASFLKSSVLSHLRSHPQGKESLFAQPSRKFHIDLGEREKALLEKDPALSRFKSSTQTVKRIKKAGDVLTIVVMAGCIYELYVRFTTREDSRKQ